MNENQQNYGITKERFSDFVPNNFVKDCSFDILAVIYTDVLDYSLDADGWSVCGEITLFSKVWELVSCIRG